MATGKTKREGKSPRPRRATTPEGRQDQLIALAERLAEKQLEDGTASSQTIVHFLKLGSTRERLEEEKLRHETEVLKAKRASYESQANQEKLFQEAIEAMSTYAPPSEDSV